MGDLETLIDMGFAKEDAAYALKVTNNRGVEPAMEWLLAHGDEKAEIDSRTEEVASSEQNGPGTSIGTSESAQSLKCDECGKVCASQAEVQVHVTKTKHCNFSESTEKKTLTEEEKKAQLALIEEKLKQKRIEREEREKADALEREKNRIKSGKDMTEARRRLEEMEMKKMIEQQKREKAEEKQARERVRAQIEADKAARKAREQKNDEEATSTTPATPATAASSQLVATVNASTPAKSYSQTRIQIRLLDSTTLTETFSVKEQLSAVRVFIQVKTGRTSPFGLMTSFPRKQFTDEDFDKPLEVLDLVPSAVLIMTKVAGE